MIHKLNYRQQDFRNNQIVERHRLPNRPFYCSYSDGASARERQKADSGRYLCLNGKWKFHYQTNPAQCPRDFWQPEFDDADFDWIQVPGHWQLNGFGQPHYNDDISLFPIQDDLCLGDDNPTGCYRLTFDSAGLASALAAGEEVLLRFDGVESAYHVWLNGEFVGYSQGSRLTAEFDVSHLLKPGANLLAVKVYMFCDGSYLENQDMWWFGGIMRDVCLITRPSLHIADYVVTTDFTEAQSGQADIRVEISNHSAKQQRHKIQFKLYDQVGPIAEADQWFELAPKSKIQVNQCLSISLVELWSAENPKRYDLVISIATAKEVICQPIGFRRIEIKQGVLYFNQRPITLKGVNRHDWNMSTGRVVTEQDMRSDLMLMKKNHINAIRTAHYPNQPLFYDLCDELGFYVMSEADLETNQMQRTPDYNKLSDSPDWQLSYLDRVERLVQRDRNHPSIIMWSLGNESGYGQNFKQAYQRIKQWDTTRPVHYEEDKAALSADVYSSMYTGIAELQNIGRQEQLPKPHIVCEYAHAMGNGPGSLGDYQKVFEQYPRLAGGYVWEWIDQALLATDAQGVRYFKYGGDYGDNPNNANFCADGLIQADRRPTPALVQLAKVFEPVRVLSFEKGIVTIQNRYDFTTLASIRLEWQVKAEGELICQGTVEDLPELTNCHPFESCSIPIWQVAGVEPELADQTAECRLYCRLINRAAEQSLVGSYEYCLQARKEQSQPIANQLIRVTERDHQLEVVGSNYQVMIDLATGQLKDYQIGNRPVIQKSLGLTFWRAPIDNDSKQLPIWQTYHLNYLKNTTQAIEWQVESTGCKVTIEHTVAPLVLDYRIDLTTEYQLDSRGLTIKINGVPSGTQLPPTWPRIGYRLVLEPGFDMVTWYGRGPQENYTDSKVGCLIDVYQLPVSELYFPYVRPQENGHRSDVQWLSLSDGQERIKIATDRRVGFSALPYRAEELERAKHSNELKPADGIYLTLDYAQHGLGSASWGADVLPEYSLSPQAFEMNFQISSEKEE